MKRPSWVVETHVGGGTGACGGVPYGAAVGERGCLLVGRVLCIRWGCPRYSLGGSDVLVGRVLSTCWEDPIYLLGGSYLLAGTVLFLCWGVAMALVGLALSTH
eukprot:6066620-Pyramimonas_sp.AAC.1